MARVTGAGVALAAVLLAAGASLANDDLILDWSSTFELRFKDFQSPVDDDDTTGFFDQYDFTRNKDKEPTIELALSEFGLDLLGARETPLLQVRLRSPSSDLNVSGGHPYLGEYFLNQRGKLYGRRPGLALDLDYRRLRTEEIRVFNNEGWASDATAPGDLFYTRRSRIAGELRVRPHELLYDEQGALADILSQIALRGGYEDREGQRQTRYDFLDQLTTEQDQKVTDIGAGLVVNPHGLFTMAFDFDYERFREGAPEDQGTGQTLAFIPDTDRSTGTVRLHRRVGERAVVHGGFQASSLRQQGTLTAGQAAAGLHSNKLLFYSGNVGGDVRLTDTVSMNGYFRFDHRRNGIDRKAQFFDPALGGQDYPFLESVRRIVTGTEFVYRLPYMNRVSLGVRGEWVDRDLDFLTPPGLTKQNTMVDDDSASMTAYLKTVLRPARGVYFSGELGYRNSPETAYIRELDDVGYGKFRTSYTLPVARPVTVSVFGAGEIGKNDDFTQLGATPGNAANRDFDREKFAYGVTITSLPVDEMTLFGSLHQHFDSQDFDLWTNPDRFGGLDFSLQDPLDYRAQVTTAVLGGILRISAKTDLSLSYSFTRSNWRFESDNATTQVIDGFSRIRSDLQRAEIGIGHWLREGLRVSCGYRFDHYRDRTDVSTGTGSVGPFSLSTEQHTLLFGLTLNSDLFGGP